MKIRIGTRASQLALAQTDLILRRLQELLPTALLEIVHISTLGDRKQNALTQARGDKRDWIYELELAVLDGSIDMAVHSGKDVPAEIAPQTLLLSVLKRELPCDVFIGRRDLKNGPRLAFSQLPNGARIGTTSLRRRAQLLRVKPDVQVIDHRGNVPTRITKLDTTPDLAGIVLAAAGLRRLGLNQVELEYFETSVLLPAVNQGILTVQLLSKRTDLKELLTALSDRQTQAAFEAERQCVSVLNADCDSALAVFAEPKGDQLALHARVLLPDGSTCLELRDEDYLSEAAALGLRVGQALIVQGAARILEESRKLRS